MKKDADQHPAASLHLATQTHLVWLELDYPCIALDSYWSQYYSLSPLSKTSVYCGWLLPVQSCLSCLSYKVTSEVIHSLREVTIHSTSNWCMCCKKLFTCFQCLTRLKTLLDPLWVLFLSKIFITPGEYVMSWKQMWFFYEGIWDFCCWVEEKQFGGKLFHNALLDTEQNNLHVRIYSLQWVSLIIIRILLHTWV